MFKTTTPMGDMIMASDGMVAWRKDPSGYALLTDAQFEELKNQSGIVINLLDPEARLKDTASKVENAGKQTFLEKECWRLHITRKDGKQTDAFYDVASGLPIGAETIEKRGEQEIRSRMLISDWKEQQGVNIFRVMKVESPNQPDGMTFNITAVEVNTVDDAAFALPEEVKKLAEAKGAHKPAAGAGAGAGAGAAAAGGTTK
jgi:hypothetical protein